MLRFVFLCLLSVSLGSALQYLTGKREQFKLSKSAGVTGPLTQHFQDWLNKNGYTADDFVRADYGTQGSYGGKPSSAEFAERKKNKTHTRYPVVFVHGNSDAALKTSDGFTGWEYSIEYFEQQGYTSEDLYATSWGDDFMLMASTRTHNCKDIQRLRRFFQAVKDYTGEPYINVVTHSMGVTLARKVIKGGPIKANDGNCDIGKPLTFVDVFVGLAGGNFGLCSCAGLSLFAATCNQNNGYWPGDTCGLNTLCGLGTPMFPCNGPTYSSFLTDLNTDVTMEGKRVVAAYSHMDDLIGSGDMVWGRATSTIPRSTDEKTYDLYTHMQTKEKTADDQYKWVNRLDS